MTEAREVAECLGKTSQRTLVAITVDVDGHADASIEVITLTDEYLFWGEAR